MNRQRRVDPVYELTVVGRLGPALRARFRPAATTSCAMSTILWLRSEGGQDLVDVLRLLVSHGLEVTTISATHVDGPDVDHGRRRAPGPAGLLPATVG